MAVYEAAEDRPSPRVGRPGPTFVEGKTYRQRGHYEGDPQVYRSKEEMELWKTRDPVPAFRQRLAAAQVLDEGALEEIEGEVFAALDDAVQFAKSAAMPRPEEALAGVYADVHGGLVF